MNLFSILKQQVKKALSTEANHEPEIRALFDWRYSVEIKGQMYIVGKTGANTCFYIEPGTSEPIACYPDALLDKIDQWGSGKYVSYAIYFKRFESPVAENIKSLEKVMTGKPKTFKKGYFICGVTPKGKRVKLYRLQQGLSGMQWVAVEPKK
ncbi:hypothetical protein MPK67_gp023 [Erwinia phage pEa_SNUABM_32]|uniref:Uncharacterized protein n=1 Tax=Erwinia phage pEa_SNUABM_32 TaxID=2869555 RepID=A0AAE7XKL2_9CAUD|nr:hypothetical protein MPK67_gp023 [Erwinia phage pEa_SNUABM_32]QZE56896.1 hypothetical protein pEaSNUABM32_00023 [Erwinia phage pEa_SNUABM_32]